MSRSGTFCVYMVTNKGNTVLYTGITNDIHRRLFEHRVAGSDRSFAWRYQCWKLVYLEEFQNVDDAIQREGQIKNWKRAWKDELVSRTNPEWIDLSKGWNYEGWFDPADPPAGYYTQHLKENWGGPDQ